MTETLTTIEKALFLKEFDVFRSVSVEHLAEMAAAALELHFEPGSTIVRQEDASQHVYVVVEGAVVTERDGIVVNVVGSRKGFGDLSLEPGARYGFAARAVEQTHVLRISTEDLVDAMLEHPEIAVGIVRTLGVRLREAASQLAELGRQLQDDLGPRAATRAETPESR